MIFYKSLNRSCATLNFQKNEYLKISTHPKQTAETSFYRKVLIISSVPTAYLNEKNESSTILWERTWAYVEHSIEDRRFDYFFFTLDMHCPMSMLEQD